MEGKEPVKQDREYDSETGKTTVRPALNEAVDLDAEQPKAAAAAAAAAAPAPKATPAAKALSDEELLAQLDDLDAK
jgi:hypothetical protein